MARGKHAAGGKNYSMAISAWLVRSIGPIHAARSTSEIFLLSKEWTLDGFWTRPVPFAQHANDDTNFDSPDSSQEFLGLYATDQTRKIQVIDYYYLRFAEYQGPGSATLPVDYDPMVFGSRWAGKVDNYFCDGSFYWDTEGGYQFGSWGALDQTAGFATVGIGRDWSKAQYKPKFMLYYDYASGDKDPTDNKNQTFFQYFPLGHKYFGFADLVARQNIHDLNGQLTLATSKKSTLTLWHHIFWLDSARDGLYNAPGNRILFDPTGAAGVNVGQELDLIYQYNFGPRSDVLFGYSHFWSGSYVDTLRPTGTDIDFTYIQYSLRF